MDIRSEITKYLDYCMYRKELNPNTLRAYSVDLKQFCDYMNGAVIDKKKINHFITDLHKKYKQKTIKRKIASVKALFNYLEDEEIVQPNPFYKIKVKFRENVVLPKIIARNAIEDMLNYMYLQYQGSANKRKFIIRDIAVVELLFATGIRVSELSNITVENINLSEGTIKIVGKGSRERYVQIGNNDVLSILTTYYKEELENSGHEYFFLNRTGSRYSEQSIRKMIKKYSIEIGTKVIITPHMFRHSFATYLIEEGVDISYVQKMLGHSSIRTTQIYLHIASEKQAEILRSMHPRNRMKVNTA